MFPRITVSVHAAQGFGIHGSRLGLESCNKDVKESHTLRKRLPFAEFIKVTELLVEYWAQTCGVRYRKNAMSQAKCISGRANTAEDRTGGVQKGLAAQPEASPRASLQRLAPLRRGA